MKIFIAPEDKDARRDLLHVLKCIKEIRTQPKVYLVGQMVDWEIVENNFLHGLLKTPDGIRKLLNREDDAPKIG